jgi:predicted adenine nucleotide alpha hydrolase (AANH) superfamily ATPase
MTKKIDGNKQMLEIIKGLKDRPKLLLHVCCAPCASAVLPKLTPYFDVDILFFNPNITDFDEYEKRREWVEKLADILNKDSSTKIGIVPARYMPSEFYDEAEGLETEKEGGARCSRCFYLRLEETARRARALGYQYFCTTLTLSPHKNAELINEIGYMVEEGLPVKYLPSDFKKENGYKKSVDFCTQHGIYRQTYCGCEFSQNQKDDDNEK